MRNKKFEICALKFEVQISIFDWEEYVGSGRIRLLCWWYNHTWNFRQLTAAGSPVGVVLLISMWAVVLQ